MECSDRRKEQNSISYNRRGVGNMAMRITLQRQIKCFNERLTLKCQPFFYNIGSTNGIPKYSVSESTRFLAIRSMLLMIQSASSILSW